MGLNDILLNLLKDYDIDSQSIGTVDGKRSTWIHLKLKPKTSKPFAGFTQEIFYWEVQGHITYLAPEVAYWVRDQTEMQVKPKINFGTGKRK